MRPDRDAILKALENVIDPELRRPVTELDMVRDVLGAGLAVTGSVEEYEESAPPDGAPAVSFMVGGIATAGRQMAWSAVGTNRGNDGVWFFGVGQVPTAHELAARMARATVDRDVGSPIHASGRERQARVA